MLSPRQTHERTQIAIFYVSRLDLRELYLEFLFHLDFLPPESDVICLVQSCLYLSSLPCVACHSATPPLRRASPACTHGMNRSPSVDLRYLKFLLTTTRGQLKARTRRTVLTHFVTLHRFSCQLQHVVDGCSALAAIRGALAGDRCPTRITLGYVGFRGF